MSDVIMGLAGVIQHEIEQLNAVAQNAANAGTPGYRAVRSFATLAGVAPGGDPGAGLGSASMVRTDDGALRHTGLSTDLALSGDGWFVVQAPQGLRLTRDGRFQLDADGMLVNARGWPVLGTDGPLHPGAGFTVARDGSVSAGGTGTGRLRVMTAADVRTLRPDSDGLYAADSLAAAGKYSVYQGTLEQSNSDLGADMVRLMEATRHIESVQRALSAYDNVLGSGISQLGKE